MLKDWMISYVKSKDANFKNIETLSQKDNVLTVIHVSTSVGSGFKRQSVPKVATYVAMDNLSFGNFIADTTIITLNTKKNLNFLIDHFEDFVKNETLKIIFTNPSINETWQIHPFRHAKVSKMMASPVKPGILSLFETVPEYIL